MVVVSKEKEVSGIRKRTAKFQLHNTNNLLQTTNY